jgi:hypothetical protein
MTQVQVLLETFCFSTFRDDESASISPQEDVKFTVPAELTYGVRSFILQSLYGYSDLLNMECG